ncbi:DsbC family protein [Gluconacetobacter diazotrophicus]|uniref:DsbC family protein n=1 Tax=Gluconacetobacter diazotrophicus TaxID=33996 RepID=A0A7W4I566_GLUDI|nr:DsbC family protein [Gluconacetobacter diazotrophicus]MBB2156646.1 DsbC family protein [Gluconacetobacter diazotrophicus]
MRHALATLAVALLPGIAYAAPACPTPEAIERAPVQPPPPAPHEPVVAAPTPDQIPYRRFTAAEVARSSALQRLGSQGAQLYSLGQTHGLAGVFAMAGTQFRVFYLAPDGQAEIQGVMWDDTGHNVTRDQVAPIAGTIPTIHWTPRSQPGPQGPTPAGSTATQPAVDPVARLAAANYGLEGPDGARRVYMVVDPLCPYSTRAMSRLQPFVTSGRLQLAIVPIAINDYENHGASTPAAIDMLSADPGQMGTVWREISAQGHARPGHVPAPTAAAQLHINMDAERAIGVTGTPTFVWRDKSGQSHMAAGLPEDIDGWFRAGAGP